MKEVTAKQLTAFYKSNQVIKRVLTHYLVSLDGIIVTDTDKALQVGDHFCKCSPANAEAILNILPNPEHFYKIDALAVFRALDKGGKKDVTALSEIDGILYLITSTDVGMIAIGKAVEYEPFIPVIKLAKAALANTNQVVEYTAEDTLSVFSGGLIIMTLDEYKVRVAKSILPNLQKTSILKVFFNPVSERVFTCTIYMERDDILSYHTYHAMYY